MTRRTSPGCGTRGGLLLALAVALAMPAAAAHAQPGDGGGAGYGYGMMNHGMMGSGMMGHGTMGGGMTGYGSQPPPPPAGAGGSATYGARLFASQCAACHSLQADAPRMVGPSLHGLFGRRAGTVPGYAYSAAMRDSGVVWDSQTLNAFLAAPQRDIPGDKMPFAGIANSRARQALITYLRATSR